MKALVVYESFWGNTAAVAVAIAEGIGLDARAVPTDLATGDALRTADLVVAGAPVIAFGLASDAARAGIARHEGGDAHRPDMEHQPMRAWLEALPAGRGSYAAFETRIWWSPRGATGDIEKRLDRAGYRRIAKAGRFVVEDTYGPLRDGELDRARRWGGELRRLLAVAA